MSCRELVFEREKTLLDISGKNADNFYRCDLMGARKSGDAMKLIHTEGNSLS